MKWYQNEKNKTQLHTQDKYGNTALHYACEEERNEVARLLISHGANREVVCSINT